VRAQFAEAGAFLGIRSSDVGKLNRPELDLMLRADRQRHLRTVGLIVWAMSFFPAAVGAGIALGFGDKGKAARSFARSLARARRKYARRMEPKD
jgi:hypothetical protein